MSDPAAGSRKVPAGPEFRQKFETFVRIMLVSALIGAVLYPRPRDHQAAIQPIEVLPRSADACAEATGGAKIALLFLTAGDLHHTPTWTHWFRSAAGILPSETAADTACRLRGVALEAAAAACSSGPTDDVIGQQHLFSVYVHLTAEIHESKLGKLWRPHLIRKRVPTEWGTHSLMEATRHLLWESFRDPANQRFVLISESDLPIWDPLTLYRQLMAEERSRVDAWWHPDLSPGQWSPRMAAPPANVQLSEWRKSAQWFAIVRSHAEIVLRDRDVFVAFEQYCRSGWDQDVHRYRECYSDEHYLATLLHMKGLQEETVPSPLGVTVADWSEGKPHPREYQPSEVTPALFSTKLRTTPECPLTPEQHATAQESSRRTFVPLSQVFGTQRTAWCEGNKAGGGGGGGGSGDESRVAGATPTSLLPSTCFLLARKFGPPSVEAVEKLFLNCTSGLDLIGDTVCAGKGEGLGSGAAITAAAEQVASQAIELLESVSEKFHP